MKLKPVLIMSNSHSDIYYLLLIGTITLMVFASFIINFLFIYHRRQQKHLQEKQTLQTRFQQTLLQSQLEIQEQTLQNISQEIHDNIGQVLSLTKLNLGTTDISKPVILQQKIDDSRTLVGRPSRTSATCQ